MVEHPERYTVTPAAATVLGKAILEILEQARAANIRVTGRDLAKRLEERDDRRIRIVIEQLIEQGHLIAASNHEPFGYFLIEELHDAQIYESTLRSRARQTLKRLANFRRAVARKFGSAQQMPLFAVDAALKELER